MLIYWNFLLLQQLLHLTQFLHKCLALFIFLLLFWWHVFSLMSLWWFWFSCLGLTITRVIWARPIRAGGGEARRAVFFLDKLWLNCDWLLLNFGFFLNRCCHSHWPWCRSRRCCHRSSWQHLTIDLRFSCHLTSLSIELGINFNDPCAKGSGNHRCVLIIFWLEVGLLQIRLEQFNSFRVQLAWIVISHSAHECTWLTTHFLAWTPVGISSKDCRNGCHNSWNVLRRVVSVGIWV